MDGYGQTNLKYKSSGDEVWHGFWARYRSYGGPVGAAAARVGAGL